MQTTTLPAAVLEDLVAPVNVCYQDNAVWTWIMIIFARSKSLEGEKLVYTYDVNSAYSPLH